MTHADVSRKGSGHEMYGIAYAREPIREMLQDFHLLTGIRVAYYPISA